jgi:hypothetical protein
MIREKSHVKLVPKRKWKGRRRRHIKIEGEAERRIFL